MCVYTYIYIYIYTYIHTYISIHMHLHVYMPRAAKPPATFFHLRFGPSPESRPELAVGGVVICLVSAWQASYSRQVALSHTLSFCSTGACTCTYQTCRQNHTDKASVAYTVG